MCNSAEERSHGRLRKNDGGNAMWFMRAVKCGREPGMQESKWKEFENEDMNG